MARFDLCCSWIKYYSAQCPQSLPSPTQDPRWLWRADETSTGIWCNQGFSCDPPPPSLDYHPAPGPSASRHWPSCSWRPTTRPSTSSHSAKSPTQRPIESTTCPRRKTEEHQPSQSTRPTMCPKLPFPKHVTVNSAFSRLSRSPGWRPLKFSFWLFCDSAPKQAYTPVIPKNREISVQSLFRKFSVLRCTILIKNMVNLDLIAHSIRAPFVGHFLSFAK